MCRSEGAAYCADPMRRLAQYRRFLGSHIGFRLEQSARLTGGVEVVQGFGEVCVRPQLGGPCVMDML